MFGVTILGNNSALPAFDRHPTAQVITISDQLMLIDCGEGTQMQLARYKIRWGRINHIFISHLHGDHYFGLPGLLNTMGLLNREQELNLYGPPALMDIIYLQLSLAQAALPYRINFFPLNQQAILIKDHRFSVSCFPTSHRIPCWGFRFDEVRAPRKINPQRAAAHGVPPAQFDRLKLGEDYISESGERFENALLTEAAPKPRSYAYCADTRYEPGIVPYIRGCDLIYHETTYLQALEKRAAERFHSTTLDAAKIAKQAQVRRLLIGHFSSKYDTLERFEEEARTVFPATDLAQEGVSYPVFTQKG